MARPPQPGPASASDRSSKRSRSQPTEPTKAAGDGEDGAKGRRPGRRRSSRADVDHVPSSRAADKSRTRRALLDGALALLEDRTLDNLAIREVTRAAGVAPAAFYRHFERIDELGLVLVDEAFTTLRQLMRGACDDVNAAEDMIKQSVRVLVRHVHDNRAHYRFIAREQYSPVTSVRLAIRREIRLFATELATDLARLPVVDTWPTADLVMLADLIVGLMVDTSKRLLDVIEEAPDREPEVVADTERRLRYLTYGAIAWKPKR